MAFPNNSTGAWTGIMFSQHGNFCSGRSGEIRISAEDRNTLRELAERKARLAFRDGEQEKRERWYRHNALQEKRPLILADPENGWNEIITKSAIRCQGDLARRWELVLRKDIFWGEEILDDRPSEACFDVGHTFEESDVGIVEDFQGGKEGGAYTWEPHLRSLEDVQAIHPPEIRVDQATTRDTIDLARQVLGDILEVRLRSAWWWSFGLTSRLVVLMGMQNMMLHLYDNPDLVHACMGRLRDGCLQKLDFLVENRLLTLNNDDAYVASGGLGYSRELPGGGFDPQKVRTADLWGFSESQETTGISPMMFQEFIFAYQLPILERFGLNCYGCCEPLDERWPVIKSTPNLRRLSVSAWADKRRMAEYLQDDYIYSLKPNPADLALRQIDQGRIRKLTREYLEITKGCVLETIMKDNHTLGGNPHNLTEWVRITREEIDRMYG